MRETFHTKICIFDGKFFNSLQGHVAGYTTPEVSQNSSHSINRILELPVFIFCMFAFGYLARICSWASLKPLFQVDKKIQTRNFVFPFSNFARHLSITKYVSLVCVMPVVVCAFSSELISIFSRIPTFFMTEEKLAAYFQMPYENLGNGF